MSSTQMVPAGGESSAVKDLTEVSNAMKAYVSNENDAVLQMAVERMNQNPGFWHRLFPGAFDKEQSRIALDRVKSAYVAKKQFLDLYVNIQLEIATQRGSALVSATGMDLRAKLAEFAALKIKSLTTTLIESREEFQAKIAKYIRDLKQYDDIPELHDEAKQSAVREIKAYMNWVESLREGFTQAMDSKVNGK